jgi:hypothetical protein
MSGGMPYHLEKGALRLLEQHVNCGREGMGRILRTLREADGTRDWVLGLLPDFEDQRGLLPLRHSTGREFLHHFTEHWLGKVNASQPGGEWSRRDGEGRIGYWTAYTGDVEQIVRKALVWALELALGLERGAPPETRDEAGEPDPVELFWMCPVNWVEAWVVRRPVGEPERGRGLVTLCFITPAHAGSDIAEGPVAHALTAATTAHAHAVPSIEDDYEQLDVPWPFADVMPDRPRVKATDRQHATWVVTHREHRPVAAPPAVDDSTAPSAFGDWDAPRLNVYEGVGEVVIVSPSMAAGGVTHDGGLPPPLAIQEARP